MKKNKYNIVLRSLLIGILSFAFVVSNAQDQTAPDAPVIDSVTVLWTAPVNPNGDVLITWQKSDSTDVRSYYIKFLNEVLGTYKFLDSVDANTTVYLDTKVVTDPHYPQTYVIQAIDSADNTSNHSEPHKTVRVFPWQKDENCRVNVELSWNEYLGWDEGVDYYDLYTVENTVHNYIGRFDANVTTHLYPISGNNPHYEYYVRVKSHNGRSSTSNKIPFTPDLLTAPNYINAKFVTVEGERIRIRFEMDSLADIKNYHLMRSTDLASELQEVMQFNNYQEGVLDIYDSDVEVDNYQYYYKLNLYNDCSELIDSSEVMSSILLQGEADIKEHSQDLTWSDYYSSQAYDKTYTLYRFSEAELPSIISSSSSNDYTDDLRTQNFQSFVGDFCYTIEVESDYSGPEVIKSNTVCLSHPPSVIMPTAFAPYGFSENRIFKPSFSFISAENYYFAVYDRWGSKIFETRDYKIGWTGTKNGFTYTNGVYNYYLEYYSSKGEKNVETGSFNLIN